MIDQDPKHVELANQLMEAFDIGLRAVTVEDGVLFEVWWEGDDESEDAGLFMAVLWDDLKYVYKITGTLVYKDSEYDSIEEAVNSVITTGII
jgi:hypothetical protein